MPLHELRSCVFSFKWCCDSIETGSVGGFLKRRWSLFFVCFSCSEDRAKLRFLFEMVLRQHSKETHSNRFCGLFFFGRCCASIFKKALEHVLLVCFSCREAAVAKLCVFFLRREETHSNRFCGSFF